MPRLWNNSDPSGAGEMSGTYGRGGNTARRVGFMGKRVLVVDDSAMMRKVISKSLREKGHEVVGEAKNGREAVELYMSLRPEVVTMDITMREMDGFVAAERIMGFDEKAKIVFISNLDAEKYSRDAERIGAVAYVNKHKSKDFLALIEIL